RGRVRPSTLRTDPGIHLHLCDLSLCCCLGPDVAIQHTLPPFPSTFQANIQWVPFDLFTRYEFVPHIFPCSSRITLLKSLLIGSHGRRSQATSRHSSSGSSQWFQCLT